MADRRPAPPEHAPERGPPPPAEAAPRRGSRDWEADWAHLLSRWTEPMRRQVRRVWARAPREVVAVHDPGDVVQAFLAACLEKGWLERVDPARGGVGAYLLTLVRRFALGVLRREGARRRRPAAGCVSIDLALGDAPGAGAAPAAPATAGAPEAPDGAGLDAFYRGWVGVAVDRALGRLGRAHPRDREVIADLIATDGQQSPDLGARLGLAPGPLAVLKHRARRRFARLFEEELARAVPAAEDLAALRRGLRGFLPRRR